MMAEDGGGSGGGDPGQQDLPGMGDGDKGEKPDIKDPGEGLKEVIAQQNKVIEKLQADAKKREDADRKKADKKRLEDEGAKKLLEERDKELEDAKKLLSEFETLQRNNAERLFAGLTKESQEKLKPLQEKMEIAAWIELLEIEAKTNTASPGEAGDKRVVLPPPTGSARPNRKDPNDNYTPSERGLRIMRENGISDEMIRKLHRGPSFARGNEDDLESDGHDVFSQSVHEMIDTLPKSGGVHMTLKNAAARRGD